MRDRQWVGAPQGTKSGHRDAKVNKRATVQWTVPMRCTVHGGTAAAAAAAGADLCDETRVGEREEVSLLHHRREGLQERGKMHSAFVVHSGPLLRRRRIGGQGPRDCCCCRCAAGGRRRHRGRGHGCGIDGTQRDTQRTGHTAGHSGTHSSVSTAVTVVTVGHAAVTVVGNSEHTDMNDRMRGCECRGLDSPAPLSRLRV